MCFKWWCVFLFRRRHFSTVWPPLWCFDRVTISIILYFAPIYTSMNSVCKSGVFRGNSAKIHSKSAKLKQDFGHFPTTNTLSCSVGNGVCFYLQNKNKNKTKHLAKVTGRWEQDNKKTGDFLTYSFTQSLWDDNVQYQQCGKKMKPHAWASS